MMSRTQTQEEKATRKRMCHFKNLNLTNFPLISKEIIVLVYYCCVFESTHKQCYAKTKGGSECSIYFCKWVYYKKPSNWKELCCSYFGGLQKILMGNDIIQLPVVNRALFGLTVPDVIIVSISFQCNSYFAPLKP